MEYKIGDYVLIKEKFIPMGNLKWIEEMNYTLGKVGQIIKIYNKGYKVTIDRTYWWYLKSSLQKLTEEELIMEMI